MTSVLNFAKRIERLLYNRVPVHHLLQDRTDFNGVIQVREQDDIPLAVGKDLQSVLNKLKTIRDR